MTRFTSLAVAFLLVLLTAIPTEAKEPLYGHMELEFNLGLIPGSGDPRWVGTISIDGNVYPMAFFNIGTGKPFVDSARGNVIFFGEIWRIYDTAHFDLEDQEFQYGNVLLGGLDAGVVTIANSTYRMNGSVEEASGDFALWLSRNTHMSGIIVWDSFGPPQFAPGTLRIN